MREDELIREVDRRHIIQLFDLFADSPYNALDLIEAYSRTDSRIRADAGSEYHVLKQPINVYNDILRENHLEITKREEDQIILHWMADLYVHTHYEKGLSFLEMMKDVSPVWLYTHYSPLHETSLKNAWVKAVCICGGKEFA